MGGSYFPVVHRNHNFGTLRCRWVGAVHRIKTGPLEETYGLRKPVIEGPLEQITSISDQAISAFRGEADVLEAGRFRLLSANSRQWVFKTWVRRGYGVGGEAHNGCI